MTRKTKDFEEWSWFKFNNWDEHYLWPWNLHQCGKKVKIKSQKVLESNSNVCRSYMEKLVGGELFAPKILKMNSVGGFFPRFYKTTTPSINYRWPPFKYLYLRYAWDINQLNYLFELGLLISHALHFQGCLTPQII